MILRNMSMRSVQGFQERSSSRGMLGGFIIKKPNQAKVGAESTHDSEDKCRACGGVADGQARGRDVTGNQNHKRKEDEKAETVMHLICWGPHLL